MTQTKPKPPPGWCLAGVVVAPLFLPALRACWFLLLAACGRLLPPVLPPPLPPPHPRASSGFVVACLLLLVFVCSHSLLRLLSPGGFSSLPPPRPLVVCVARLLPPCCLFFLVCPLLVCCCAPFALTACVGAGCLRPCPALTPRFVFRGWRFCALCACSACFVLPVRLAFVCAWCCPPYLWLSLFRGRRCPCCRSTHTRTAPNLITFWDFLEHRFHEYDPSRADERWRAHTPRVVKGQVSPIDLEEFYTRWQRVLPLNNETRPHVIREQLLSKLSWIKGKVVEKEVTNSKGSCVVNCSGLDPSPGRAPSEKELMKYCAQCCTMVPDIVSYAGLGVIVDYKDSYLQEWVLRLNKTPQTNGHTMKVDQCRPRLEREDIYALAYKAS